MHFPCVLFLSRKNNNRVVTVTVIINPKWLKKMLLNPSAHSSKNLTGTPQLSNCYFFFQINTHFLLHYAHYNDLVKIQFHGIMNYKLSNMSRPSTVKVVAYWFINKSSFLLLGMYKQLCCQTDSRLQHIDATGPNNQVIRDISLLFIKGKFTEA